MPDRATVVRAAVVGCGRGGNLSLDGLGDSEHFEVVAASDISVRARQETARRFPELRLFADYGDMMAQCPADVVCIASPAPTHAPIARSVLQQGVRGLLLEKPLACDAADAERLLEEIKDRHVPVVVPHGMLVLPAPMAIKRRIRRGDIGAVESVEIYNAVDLLNGGIHWLVFLLDLFGDDSPVEVSSHFEVDDRVVNDCVRVESRGTTRITMRSGVRIVLHSGVRVRPGSDVLPTEEQRGAIFRVRGSDGDIEFSAWAGSYWISTPGNSGGELVHCAGENDPGYHRIFLDRLARQVSTSKTDYRVAELSLGALRIIEKAYACYAGNEWRLGKAVEP